MQRRGFGDEQIICECGKEQAMEHLLDCPLLPEPNTQDELGSHELACQSLCGALGGTCEEDNKKYIA